jgi:hypothetical protein
VSELWFAMQSSFSSGSDRREPGLVEGRCGVWCEMRAQTVRRWTSREHGWALGERAIWSIRRTVYTNWSTGNHSARAESG